MRRDLCGGNPLCNGMGNVSSTHCWHTDPLADVNAPSVQQRCCHCNAYSMLHHGQFKPWYPTPTPQVPR